MNPLTVAQFRADFPEFADTSMYPDSMISTWLSVAATLTGNTDRWGDLQTVGQELCTAHYLIVAARDQAAAQGGAIPGQVAGLTTAQSVGDVSASYDTAAVTDERGGFWNQTSYGIRFSNLRSIIGAGGLQLPGWCC